MSKTLNDWLNWQETLHPSEIDLGLDRVKEVFYRLLPECVINKHHSSNSSLSTTINSVLPFRVITVAGTNGKGSTVAMLESIYTEAGYRVGSYTSPHLLHYNERIKINKEPVNDQSLCDSFERINKARGELSLTYFEFSTLAAIDIFYQNSCDIVILEVGLGGRLDAVNIIDPDVALVTTVDIDHQDWLGSDRDTIGIEKAGIYRSDKPAIYGDIDCPQSILDIAKEKKLSFYQYSINYQNESRAQHESIAQQWDWLIPEHSDDKQFTPRYNLPVPNLKGFSQQKNAANALMVLELLKDACPVTQSEIKRGFQNIEILGRFQVVSNDPLVILDVAHNVQAAKMLRNSIEDLKSNLPGKLHVIVGMLEDKDVLDVLSVFAPIVDSWRIIELDSPRAMPAKDVASILKNSIKALNENQKKIQCFADFKLAYQDFNENRLMLNSIDKLLVFGSFFTVTDALLFFQSLNTNTSSTTHE